jgi:hypothetical protein
MNVRAIRKWRCVAVTSALMTAGTASAQVLYLYPVEFPNDQLWPQAISADGSVVVGRIAVHPTNGTGRAGMWRPDSGIFELVLPEPLNQYVSLATGVSDNGEVIAGDVTFPATPTEFSHTEVFVKTPEGFDLPNPFEARECTSWVSPPMAA